MVGNAQLGGVGQGRYRPRVHLRFARRAARAARPERGRRRARAGCCRPRTTSTNRSSPATACAAAPARAFRIDLASGEVARPGHDAGRRRQLRLGRRRYGDVVGWAEDATDHNNAFVYAAGLGGMRKLADLVDPALGWQLVQANAINAHGHDRRLGLPPRRAARLQARASGLRRAIAGHAPRSTPDRVIASDAEDERPPRLTIGAGALAGGVAGALVGIRRRAPCGAAGRDRRARALATALLAAAVDAVLGVGAGAAVELVGARRHLGTARRGRRGGRAWWRSCGGRAGGGRRGGRRRGRDRAARHNRFLAAGLIDAGGARAGGRRGVVLAPTLARLLAGRRARAPDRRGCRGPRWCCWRRWRPRCWARRCFVPLAQTRLLAGARCAYRRVGGRARAAAARGRSRATAASGFPIRWRWALAARRRGLRRRRGRSRWRTAGTTTCASRPGPRSWWATAIAVVAAVAVRGRCAAGCPRRRSAPRLIAAGRLGGGGRRRAAGVSPLRARAQGRRRARRRSWARRWTPAARHARLRPRRLRARAGRRRLRRPRPRRPPRRAGSPGRRHRRRLRRRGRDRRAAAAGAYGRRCPPTVPRDLNLLLITIDTLRADHLGSYGYPRPTSPAIDALAAEGTLFENGWAHAPSTRYSMPAIAAGRWPSAITGTSRSGGRGSGPTCGPPRRRCTTPATVTGGLFSFSYFAPGDRRGFERGMDDYHAERAALHVAVNGPMESRGSSSREMADDAIAFVDAHRDQQVLPVGALLRSAPRLRDAPRGARRSARRASIATTARSASPTCTSAACSRTCARRACGTARPSCSPAITAKASASTASPSTASTSTRAQTKVPFIVRVPGLAPRRVRVPVGHVDIAPDAGEPGARRGRAGVHRALAGPGRRRAAGRADTEHARRVPGGDLGAREEARAGDRDAPPDLERGAGRHHRVLRPQPRSGRGRTTSGSGRGRRRRVRGAGARRLERLVAGLALPPGAAEKLARRRDAARARRRRRPRRRAATPCWATRSPCAATTCRRRRASPAGGTLDVTYHFAAKRRASPPAGGCSSTWKARRGYRNLDHVPVDGLMPLERWRPGQAHRATGSASRMPPGTPPRQRTRSTSAPSAAPNACP